MSSRHTRLALAALVAVTVACERSPSEMPAGASPLAGRSTAPARTGLPTAEEQRAIVQAIAAGGGRVGQLFPSKFDWLFGGAAPRSGTFEVTIDTQQTWADVHFLERNVGKIVACSAQPNWSNAGTFSISVDGRLRSLSSTVTGAVSSGTMYFGASDRYFVMTPDSRLRDELARALALRVPSCREPVDLPELQWEGEVTEALARAGIEVTLVGGSKFESLLGERQPTRVFIQTPGAAGADVLFLDRPVAGVRVCYSRASSGSDRTEIFVGDRLVSAGEGSQQPRYSINDRYFVQAFGSAFHEALMRGLGTREPPC